MKRILSAAIALAFAASLAASAQEISRSDSLTAAISSVKGEDIWNLSASDPVKALTGKMAGVLVLNTSGEPGAASGIKVRGFSARLSEASPLFIVDGLRVDDLQYLAPEMIESIEVVKDATAAALYGMEAREGAVVIKTRKGQGGKGHVFYRNEFALASLAHKARMMDAQDFQDVFEYYQRPSLTELIMANFNGTGTDWASEIFEPSWNSRHTVGVQGGNDRGGYFASFSNYSSNGIFLGDNDRYRRTSGQVNGSYEVAPWLHLSTSNAFESHNGGTVIPYKSPLTSITSNPIAAALIIPAVCPVYVDRDGLAPDQIDALDRGLNVVQDPETGLYMAPFGIDLFGHPLIMKNHPEKTYRSTSFRGSATAVFTPLKGLDLTARFGYSFEKGSRKEVYTPFYYNRWYTFDSEKQEVTDIDNGYYQGELIASYDRTFGKHGIDINGGTLYHKYVEKTDWFSYFGHLGYTFDGRYTLSGNLHITSRGGRDSGVKKSPIAYSVAAGARVMDGLNLRASWGMVKNVLFSGEKSIFYHAHSGILFCALNSTALNVGADKRLLDGKLTASLDFFRNSDETIAQYSLWEHTIGPVTNTGLELSMNMEDSIGDFRYSVSANATYLRNRLVSLYEGITGIRADDNCGINRHPYSYLSNGEPIWYMRGIKALGVDPQSGEAILEDVDSDGYISVFADGGNIGSGIPDLTFGLSANLAYRNFDLSISGSGAAGNQIFSSYWSSHSLGHNNYKRIWEGTWKKPGDNAKYPSPMAAIDENVTASTFYVWNGSYFKIRQIQLGYSLPESLLSKVWVKQLRVYASLDNFLCLTGFPGLDPETAITSDQTIGFDHGSYPNPRQIAFGVNLSF